MKTWGSTLSSRSEVILGMGDKAVFPAYPEKGLGVALAIVRVDRFDIIIFFPGNPKDGALAAHLIDVE